MEPQKSGLLFNITKPQLRFAFADLLEQIGIEEFRWHDLRHSYASQAVLHDCSLTTLQKILGHSTINMTMRYAHLSKDYLAKEVKVLDNVFSPIQNIPQLTTN